MLRFVLILVAFGFTISTAAAQDAPQIARGQALVSQHKCAMCHVIAGKGGKLSKPLDGVSPRLDVAALTRILRDPQAAFPDARLKMPKVSWKPGEAEAVAAYLASLKATAAR